MKILIALVISWLLIPGATSAQDKTCTCCSTAHQAFDFWVGEWTVTNVDGSPAGKNTVDKLQDNCIVRENWTSAKGNFTGTSYNHYDSQNQAWRQLWIDNQGSSLELRGQRVANQMILRSDDAQNKDDKTFYHQITWTANADGSVRQLWETFTAGSEPTVAFDGLYKKSPDTPTKD